MPRRLLASNAPNTLSGLVAWLKADALALSDGDLVASWTDSSGNANTPVQATGANKPTFKTSIINGLPIIRFDGARTLVFPTAAHFDLATPTIFAVFLRTGGGTVISKNTTGFTDGHRRKMQIAVTSSGIAYDSGNDGQSISVAATTANFNMFGVLTNGDASHSMFLNGTQTDSTVTLADSTLNSAAAQIGQAFSNGAEGFAGDIAEIVVYNRPLAAIEVVGLQNYLANKYNLTVSSTLGGAARVLVSGRVATTGRVAKGSGVTP